MAREITFDALCAGCADDSFDDGIRIDTELEPLAGAGAPVKPAVYEGGRYQMDRRWGSTDDAEPTPVIVVDNVPSQANRLEDALRQHRDAVGVPELRLDLSQLGGLPAHLPESLSSLQFPHRNADAYLRDAQIDGEDFLKTELGKSIFDATARACGPLMAWFPQALLYGFWQSHLGKKRTNSKACASLGFGDHRLAAGGRRHEDLGAEGRPAEPVHRRRRDLQPKRPSQVGCRQGEGRR